MLSLAQKTGIHIQCSMAWARISRCELQCWRAVPIVLPIACCTVVIT
jgi:hypothetical protein